MWQRFAQPDREDGRLGPLYHGTRSANGRRILREGFRRSASRSYTGTGICLSESLTVPYEYGMYETGGCVLAACIAPSARWTDRIDAQDGRLTQRDVWDRFFEGSSNEAVRGFGGNVWVVWNPAVLAVARRLTYREALRRLCAEFEEDGPDCGCNGVVSDYASIWWGQEAGDPNLTRFPEHLSTLRQRLLAHGGAVQVAADVGDRAARLTRSPLPRRIRARRP